jgi:hypothetical protein
MDDPWIGWTEFRSKAKGGFYESAKVAKGSPFIFLKLAEGSA